MSFIFNTNTIQPYIDTGGGGEAVLSTLTVTPSTSSQTIRPTSGVDGYNVVNVSGVDATIDNNIISSNIASGVTILGVTGSATLLNGESVNITPTTSVQTITPTSPANGITVANVSAVTSTIDPNILPENIKKDVSILNVIGTLESGGGEDFENFLKRCLIDGTVVDSTSSYNANRLTATAFGTYIDSNRTAIDVPNVELCYGNVLNSNVSLSYFNMPKLKIACSNIFTLTNSSNITITEINLPELLACFGYVCRGVASVTKIIIPKLMFCNSYPINNCTNLEYVNAKSYVGFGSSKISTICASSSNIKCVVAGKLTTINSYVVGESTMSLFETLVLDGVDGVIPLTDSKYLKTAHYPKFNDGTASIYVPDSLVNDYKNATNWSTLAAIIKPMSQFQNPYE